jgi:hypothetical protein
MEEEEGKRAKGREVNKGKEKERVGGIPPSQKSDGHPFVEVQFSYFVQFSEKSCQQLIHVVVLEIKSRV